MPGVFVAGTDTGVGKTAIACGLVAVLRRAGHRPAVMKPVETGHGGAGASWPADAEALRQAAGLECKREEVVPYAFAEALAPAVAAARAGTHIELAVLDAAFRALEARHGHVVVEGAGGLAVPIDERTMVSDLAARWNLPAVLVCRAGLGTLNHTLLSLEHARRKGIHVLGLVVNGARPGAVADATNPEWLARLGQVPVLAVVPWLDGSDTATVAREVAKRIQPEDILGRSQPSSPTRAWKP